MSWDEKISHLSQGFRQASGLLIKRGTAMGPLIPLLSLAPIFLFFAWLFREIQYAPPVLIFTTLAIVFEYLRHYNRFAHKDPDRLQSEQFRAEMTRMHIISGKNLPHPAFPEELRLTKPSSNPIQDLPTIDSIERKIESRDDEELAK